MTTSKWAAPVAITTALSTELNSLADGSYSAASSAYDNETNLYLYADVEIVLASLTPTSGAFIALYLVKSLDGTNFADGGGATAPAAADLVAQVDLSTSTGAKRRVVANIPIPPLQFKWILLNEANVALASSGNTLKVRYHNEQGV